MSESARNVGRGPEALSASVVVNPNNLQRAMTTIVDAVCREALRNFNKADREEKLLMEIRGFPPLVDTASVQFQLTERLFADLDVLLVNTFMSNYRVPVEVAPYQRGSESFPMNRGKTVLVIRKIRFQPPGETKESVIRFYIRFFTPAVQAPAPVKEEVRDKFDDFLDAELAEILGED